MSDSVDVLIDIDNLKVVAVAKQPQAVRKLEYIAELEIPKNHDFYICGSYKRDLAKFDLEELKKLAMNTADRQLKTEVYSVAIEEVYHIIQEELTPDKRSLEDLITAYGKQLPAIDPKPLPEARSPKSRVESTTSIPGRPKEGSSTGKVWDICDDALEHFGDIHSKEMRKQIIDFCVESGINPATANTQFAKWKKHHINS
ncbi:hypothetical protein S0112_002 [Shewanella phage S0112]|nr:hypothetical protein S0112_002 [Shewanella phage S0112]